MGRRLAKVRVLVEDIVTRQNYVGEPKLLVGGAESCGVELPVVCTAGAGELYLAWYMEQMEDHVDWQRILFLGICLP